MLVIRFDDLTIRILPPIIVFLSFAHIFRIEPDTGRVQNNKLSIGFVTNLFKLDFLQRYILTSCNAAQIC